MDNVLALDDITVLEFADIRGEFLGKLLAGLGATVIKIEPPGGSPSRKYGPFHHDTPHPERSLCYWHYNVGKKGITLNLETEEGRSLLKQLSGKADLVIETARPGYLPQLGLGYSELRKDNPGLVMISITDFGQSGPWRDYKGSDMVFLALGGQMMISGYPPGADGKYETPPIVPQMWQSVHVADSMACFDLLAALWYRRMTGHGQYIDYSLHIAMNSFTENLMSRYLTDHYITNRNSQFDNSGIHTKDGYPVVCMQALFPDEWDREVTMLAEAGAAQDLVEPQYEDTAYRSGQLAHINQVRKDFVASMNARELFDYVQRRSTIWAPVLPPEAGPSDPHWIERGNFTQIAHPELGESFTYTGSPWVAKRMPWRDGPRAPLLGEHNVEVYEGLLCLSRKRLIALVHAVAI